LQALTQRICFGGGMLRKGLLPGRRLVT